MNVAESLDGNPPVGVPFAKLYRVGQCWLEIEMAFILFRNAHLKCIFVVEILNLDSRNVGHEEINPSGVDRDQFVLVDITKFVQLPKGMTLRRTRCFVRLKSINLSPNVVGESPQSFGVVAPSVPTASIPFAKVFGNWEVDVFRGISPSIGHGHLPSHLIETRPETVQELSKFHSQHRVEGFQLEPLDVSSVLRVILGDDGVRFFHVGGHVPIESVKVKLCPFVFCYEIPSGTRNHFPSPL